jgi:hypothetical protein
MGAGAIGFIRRDGGRRDGRQENDAGAGDQRSRSQAHVYAFPCPRILR